jgi:hypothetical protein
MGRLELDRSGTRVALYLMLPPPKDVLRKKLKAVADVARGRIKVDQQLSTGAMSTLLAARSGNDG